VALTSLTFLPVPSYFGTRCRSGALATSSFLEAGPGGQRRTLGIRAFLVSFPPRLGRGKRIPLISKHNTISVGKYIVSPLSKPLDDGGYCASVSIRGGRGSASTDRVMRFTGRFDSERAAHRYAQEQGLIWVSQSSLPATCISA